MKATDTATAIRAHVEATFREAERIFGRTFPRPTVRTDIRGSSRNGYADSFANVVNFNLRQAMHNGDRFLTTTVVHECAHLITRHVYGQRNARGRRVQPHGPEWASVMRKLGAEPNRCSLLEVDPALQAARAAKRSKLPAFYCACPDIVHNIARRTAAKIHAGATYRCRRCHSTLTPRRAERILLPDNRVVERIPRAADAVTTPPTAAPSRPATPSGAMRQIRLL